MKVVHARARRSAKICESVVLMGLGLAPVLARAGQPALPNAIESIGRVQCIGARKSSIAPVPLHPVTEVRIQPGSRVKKGQVLVKLDDDEQQAEVRLKQATLETAQLALKEARRHLAAVEKALAAVPEKQYYDVVLHAQKAERDERAARAALEQAKAELEHFEVRALTDGVVSWLNVHLGMVSRPGTTVWGEILDLREVDVVCDMTLDQVAEIASGQAAEIRRKGRYDLFGTGRTVFVGIEADPKTGSVPVYVRLSNPGEFLRSGERVSVRFADNSIASHDASTSRNRRDVH
jgi:membrane fusion protein, multidrug efflux system